MSQILNHSLQGYINGNIVSNNIMYYIIFVHEIEEQIIN